MVDPWALAPGGVGAVATYSPLDFETLEEIFSPPISWVKVVVSSTEAAGDIASSASDENVELSVCRADKEELDVGVIGFSLLPVRIEAVRSCLATAALRMLLIAIIPSFSMTHFYSLFNGPNDAGLQLLLNNRVTWVITLRWLSSNKKYHFPSRVRVCSGKAAFAGRSDCFLSANRSLVSL
jgi:hypothetical protein